MPAAAVLPLAVRVGAVEVLFRQIVAAGKADAPVHNGDFAVELSVAPSMILKLRKVVREMKAEE